MKVVALHCSFHSLILSVAHLVVAATLANASWAATLYDVDFNEPPHAVNAPPFLGFGTLPRVAATSGGQIGSAPMGNAEVLTGFGSLGEKPVQLTTIDGTPTDVMLGGGKRWTIRVWNRKHRRACAKTTVAFESEILHGTVAPTIFLESLVMGL